MLRLTKFLWRVFIITFILAVLGTLGSPWLLILRNRLLYGLDISLSLELLSAIAFYLICGASASFVLWQAAGVLKNLVNGEVFVLKNAQYVRRGSYACFIISAAACVRMIAHIAEYDSWLQLLLEYNTLFIPVFIIAGLLCLVVSSLFKSAALLKQDNDLVI